MMSNILFAQIVQQSKFLFFLHFCLDFLSIFLFLFFFKRTLHATQDASGAEQSEQVYQAPGLDYSIQNRRDQQPNSSSVYNPHGMISQHIPPQNRAPENASNPVAAYGAYEPTPSPIQ